MTIDNGKKILDEDLKIVYGGLNERMCLSEDKIKKLCKIIEDADVDIDSKMNAINYINNTGGDIIRINIYISDLTIYALASGRNRAWLEIFGYFRKIAEF